MPLPWWAALLIMIGCVLALFAASLAMRFASLIIQRSRMALEGEAPNLAAGGGTGGVLAEGAPGGGWPG